MTLRGKYDGWLELVLRSLGRVSLSLCAGRHRRRGESGGWLAVQGWRGAFPCGGRQGRRAGRGVGFWALGEDSEDKVVMEVAQGANMSAGVGVREESPAQQGNPRCEAGLVGAKGCSVGREAEAGDEGEGGSAGP